MINSVHGNLFDYVSTTMSTGTHFILHGCNSRGVMGSGFAKELRNRYPGAYDAYRSQYDITGLQLGTNVMYLIPETDIIIVNCITQQNYGHDGRKYVSYDAIDSCTKTLYNLVQSEIETDEVNFHFPLLGAGLAGGDWNIISNIIDTNLSHKSINKTLYIL